MIQTQPQQKNKLPDFSKMSRRDEAEWWDTHDFTDYKDEFEPVELKVDLEQPKDKTLVVRMQEPLRKQLDHVAHSKGLNASSLARMWIIEKLQQAA